MAETQKPDAFARIVQHFTVSARAAFSERLTELSSNLDDDEVELIRKVADEALCANARFKLNRILLLELHAAERAGELSADSESERFNQFVEHALHPEFRRHLDRRYPTLQNRLHCALANQRYAIEALVERFNVDRPLLVELLGCPPGRLIGLALGQGDLHSGGQSVARLVLDGGQLMYKPRSLRIDSTLATFLEHVFPDTIDRIRVPAVVDRGAYGWAVFVTHHYCQNSDELRTFYRGLGCWLAVLRLLGGTDIHQENLIAAGPVPVVIDIESLFAPIPPIVPSKYGHSYDLAEALIRNSVLRTGIVPFRAPMLGFDGVDLSAAGALPGQQPQMRGPIIVDEGTTRARLEVIESERLPAQNHPAQNPDVSQYWGDLGDAFLDVTERLRQLDASDGLTPLLLAFENCEVRFIRRPTQAYAEIARMLWHPASLYDEAKAIERARDLFTRNAAVVSIAPSDSDEIAREINDLCVGDVPIFVAPVNRGQIEASLADWRALRLDLEEMTIRSALVATELNRRTGERDERDGRFYFARNPQQDHLEERRRKLAATVMERLLQHGIYGDDNSATWITPETNTDGWQVQPLQADVYFGLGGVTVALAGYIHEVEFGRADAVAGTEMALQGALKVLHAQAMNDEPKSVGGFNGYGGQIWTWMTLSDLLQLPELIDRAVACAQALEHRGFCDDHHFDIVDGAAGAIVPLLDLAEVTRDERWLALARGAGRRLREGAIFSERGAGWLTVFGEPIGGFAHGAAGIAWALTRLALAEPNDNTERAQWISLADKAFAFQDSLYDETVGNWLDVRQWSKNESFHTWCNGSVGIGLAASDLYARTKDLPYLRTLRCAVSASQNQWGISHTLCHGDFSLQELLIRAAALDPLGCALIPNEPAVQIVSSIEEHRGIVGGLSRAAFTPGLMTGLAGAIHGLNRTHPECTLASPLLLERRTNAEWLH